MFENVGSKLQTITTAIFYVCSVVYVLAGVISFFAIIAEEEEISLIPLLVAAIAITSQYLITLALVGLGKIVENAEKEIGYSVKKAIVEDLKSNTNEKVDENTLSKEKCDRLNRIIELREAGFLNSVEFELEKEKILSQGE